MSSQAKFLRRPLATSLIAVVFGTRLQELGSVQGSTWEVQATQPLVVPLLMVRPTGIDIVAAALFLVFDQDQQKEFASLSFQCITRLERIVLALIQSSLYRRHLSRRCSRQSSVVPRMTNRRDELNQRLSWRRWMGYFRPAMLLLTTGCVIASLLRTFSVLYLSRELPSQLVWPKLQVDGTSELFSSHFGESGCIQHRAQENLNTSRVSLSMQHLIQPSSQQCLRLRRRNLWMNGYKLLSNTAKRIKAQQSNCTASIATLQLDNDYGIGSHLYQWSQAFCTAEEAGFRLRTNNPRWLWLDQEYCEASRGDLSPFLCYFPSIEYRCGAERQLSEINVTSPHDKRKGCLKARDETELPLLRAGAVEYIFSDISSLVLHEAERQASLLFTNSTIPDDLITVHIRYGDKFWEMDLAPIHEYVAAVQRLLRLRGQGQNDTAHIYLATEDPRAASEFLDAIPQAWNVYVDRTITELSSFRPNKGNRASWTTRNTRGRAGLMTLGSLLVALEANGFVLTTKSNWSRLLNDLRTNVLDPRCNNCTSMEDIRPGVW